MSNDDDNCSDGLDEDNSFGCTECGAEIDAETEFCPVCGWPVTSSNLLIPKVIMQAMQYSASLRAAELHWFFIQGEKALDCELYLPGTIGLMNGIEASIRLTMHQLAGKSLDDELGATLSNSLLNAAMSKGLPIDCLAFPNETDFLARLPSKLPYVEIVRLRHNLAHGNITEFIVRDLGLFTPECLRETSFTLREICRKWCNELGEFRKSKLGM